MSKDSLAVAFSEMDEATKTRFVDDTLSRLIEASKDPKKQKAIWKTLTQKVVKKHQGKKIQELTGKGKAFINQLIVALLYSMKEEFRYQWACLIYTLLNQPVPANLPEKIEAVRRFQYIHAGLNPQTYQKLNNLSAKYDLKSFDEIFQHLLILESKVE